ncbi:AAA family ATPase [Natranaerobius trueperi]|uniref:AAA+ ATPase domain-containing protein n=1 Tax=Natranaerobius trueperi TaxID=759412 RepID=A0A226BYK4_9FIRM|nr:AAA family ATPase [Natranaerobius trueperi]OWZ84093.1 hypothetical protein CDO51_05100 [Natranaerobius trueperi]
MTKGTVEILKRDAKKFSKNYSEDNIEKAKEKHERFLEKFPREKIKEMELEEYALGKTKQGSFCWWLEFHTTELGSIKGGTANKLRIYYSPKENEWKYPDGFNSVEEAWEKLRGDIIKLIEAYDEAPYEGINEENLLYSANMLKGKILYLYHPDKFLPMYNSKHIQEFLDLLDVPREKWAAKDSVECNLLLKEELKNIEMFNRWHSCKISEFLYQTYMPNTKFFKIAPGRDAMYWDEARKGGFISVGWNDLGDLNQYPDYEEFKNAFIKNDFHQTRHKNAEKANELWQFFNLKPGDKIIANKGKSQILGVGTVTEGYKFRDDFEDQKHVVAVNWEETFDPPLEIPKQDYWPKKTIIEIPQKKYLEWIHKTQDTGGFSPDQEKFFERLERALERKGQCILYGPPGTGKTYLAKQYVRWKNDKNEILKKNETSDKKVWMMVASSTGNFQWEEILDSKGKVEYTEKSIQRNFKMAKKGDKILCYKGGAKEKNKGFVGLAEVEKPLTDGTLTVRAKRSFKDTILLDEIKDEAVYKLSQPGKMGNRGTMFELNDDFVEMIRNILLEMEDQESADMLAETTTKNNLSECTFHPSFTYEDFIEGYKPIPTDEGKVVFELQEGIFTKLCKKAQESPDIPFYLIIDEINRGNVPKILGEMITLLEKDKRDMEVTLPQSKDSFVIPPNIYLIGTMNTSDRSIKMMDAALKRRFAFIECMPQKELINEEIDELGISPGKILEQINEKLVEIEGRDKQIGHAYFMKDGKQIYSVADLKEVFELEIIPLLQEYCYDDYERLAEIIGEGLVDSENLMINSEIFQEPDDVFVSELVKHFKG